MKRKLLGRTKPIRPPECREDLQALFFETCLSEVYDEIRIIKAAIVLSSSDDYKWFDSLTNLEKRLGMLFEEEHSFSSRKAKTSGVA